MFKGNDLSNKVAVVTGATRGLGRVLAEQLCQEGMSVVLNGRNKEALLSEVRFLEEQGYNVVGVHGDITDYEDCKSIMDETLHTFGRIDYLINNASITMNDSFLNSDPSVLESVVQSNSLGSLYPTKAALPHLQITKGSVIFISSLAGLHGMSSASGYCMGKMSLTALWQCLKLELASTGVHFGICYLGFVENDSSKVMLDGNGQKVKVPHRPKFVQMSQLNVARKIIRMMKRRSSKKTFSVLGKFAAFQFRYFPRLSLYLLTCNTKKNLIKNK